jgi:hypothetical protein
VRFYSHYVPFVRLGAAGVLVAAIAVTGFFVAAGARRPSAEDVAREYGRGVYANDADALWPLISTADHRAKNPATFHRQQRDLRGFTWQAVRQLAGYITATPVNVVRTGDRATVTLRFRLPHANAADIRDLMLDWDERRLDALLETDRGRIAARLAELHEKGTLPTIEGDETIELVREDGNWRVFLNWAGGVRVRFAAAAATGGALDVSVTPAEVVLAPGDQLRVTVRASNRAGHEVTTRVGHRIEPEADSRHLALLLCPLFLPVTIAPGETREFTSEYLLLADVPKGVQALAVTYVFPEQGGG